MWIGVTALSKFLASRWLIKDASFKLNAGECVALVGANGSGKSTLLKMLAGKLSADGGQIDMPRDATLGYLPQHAELNTDRPLMDELRDVFREVLSHQDEMDTLAHRMAEVDPEGEEYARVADRFGHLQHEMDRLQAYEMDSRIGRVSAGLGFHASDLERPCSAFSGGWRMRILLGRLLLHNPDIMLLDEPTNHLDLETMIWLEEWIRASDTTVLMVSHERAFMDNLARRVFEIHEGQLTIYRGNYTQYLETRAERWAQWEREYKNQQDEIERLQDFIDRFRYKATKAAGVQSRIKQLEKIERISPPPSEPGAIHFRFPEPDRGSKEVFGARGLGLAFGTHRVLENLDFSIWRGERVAVVGVNGAGKTTLIKMMAGRLDPTEGALESGVSTTVEYFAQYEDEGLAPSNTVWNEVASVAPTGSDQDVRNLLGGFFFSGENADKKIEVLSGGERTRVRLAKMLFSGANTLLLDEPTNHLDLASRRTLEGAMKAFPGTIVFVSHDRVFLEEVPTRVIEIKDGRLRSFPGCYSDYCRALAALGEESPLIDRSSRGPRKNGSRETAAKKTDPSIAERNDSQPSLPLGREEKKARQRDQRRIEREIAQLEERIAEAERRMEFIQGEMLRPDVWIDPARSVALTAEQKDLKQTLEQYYGEWESLQKSVEA